jgi:Fe-S-cluster containining protein
MMASFYAQGLKFSCTRCSSCCRIDPGFVFLSQTDLSVLAAAFKMGYDEFVETYCRWIPQDSNGRKGKKLSLREKKNFDCIFWKAGCTVYEYRPLQCRSFPFWPSNLSSRKAWERTATDCPGMNRGILHSAEVIEGWLEQQRGEKVIIGKGGANLESGGEPKVCAESSKGGC